MRPPTLRLTGALLACLLVLPATVPATDVDGPNDCLRQPVDFGDAPEAVFAYPGVPGCFPTCLSASGPGTQTFACLPISTAPGMTGFVRHVTPTGAQPYWLGCAPAGLPPQGIDSEGDGKMNATGLGFSACLSTLAVDCAEAAFGMTFGQDECTGDSDAGISALPAFSPCTSTSFAYSAYNCGTTRQVFLNVLVDWNQDGDWNDNFECAGPPVACAFEWAVKNVPVTLLPGCNALVTPAFLSGPGGADAWVRITISDDPVNDDYPWAGVATTANQSLRNGETEDYPWGHTEPCPPYEDWGDAPEEVEAYAGVSGHFPTCSFASPPGTQELAAGCPPISTPPGLTGYVKHVSVATDPEKFWLGCGTPGVDGENDGKMNATGAAASVCKAALGVDCVQAAFAMSFGQDECCGDGVDAGVEPCDLKFTACETATVDFKTFNCGVTTQCYLNILVDMNQDGDWNDNFICPTGCAYEWAVKNVLIPLPPGCTPQTSPAFLIGPNGGNGWMRITLSSSPVGDAFPWNGTAGAAGQDFLRAGETEDYPVTINEPCPQYRDFGDAPEEAQAYPGIAGHFPTCLTPTPPGDLDLSPVCPPISTPPGPTGYVMHVSSPADPFQFWLGCGAPGVDSESDGKTNDSGAPFSICATGVAVDCFETNFGLTFGQDECYGDVVDAGLDAGKLKFAACTPATFDFRAFNCKPTTQQVYLNVLVDMNQDGDWNDNFRCPAPTVLCAYEWAVKNVVIPLAPGCNVLATPSFLMGPEGGSGWLRITLTATPVTDDFPWDGSAGGPGGQGFFVGGETEDYPIEINGPCNIGYEDFGDAPEQITAYTTGISGHFPTCILPSVPGTQEIECGTPQSTLPATTGYVKHVALKTDADHFWLGCPIGAVDGEADGKVNLGGLPAASACDPAVAVDCTELMGGALAFGQDECYGDADAGLPSLVSFGRCSTQAVRVNAYNCSDHDVTVRLNILVDWNQDGDWNDNPICRQNKLCAPEWVVKNLAVTLVPGCNVVTSPAFQVGPREGDAWMRISLSSDPAPDDFPWNGTVTLPGSAFKGGETEDYPVVITPSLVSVDDERRPGGLWLAPVVPNPAMSGVLLRFSLPREMEVSLAAFDLAGRRLAQLAGGRKSAGEHTVTWNFLDVNGAPVAAGYYVVKLRAGDRVLTQRGIRVR